VCHSHRLKDETCNVNHFVTLIGYVPTQSVEMSVYRPVFVRKFPEYAKVKPYGNAVKNQENSP
jgi:hypothetical protein